MGNLYRLAAVLIGFAIALPAAAAPIARPADLRLSLTFPIIRDFTSGPPPHGKPSTVFTPVVSSSVNVDINAGTLQLAAQAVQRTTPFFTPVTGNTSIAQLRATTFGNGAGTFQVGGAGLGTDPACASAGPAEGCVSQLGFGGTMPLTGTVWMDVIPNFVELPVPLGSQGIGVGGSATGVFQGPLDAAPFTIGSAQIITMSGFAFTFHGSTNATASSFRMVSPTYVGGWGMFVTELQVTFTDGQGLPAFLTATVPTPGSSSLFVLGVAGLIALFRNPGKR